MSVLSPVTAVFAAVVPVLVAVFRGTVLSPVATGALVGRVVAIALKVAVGCMLIMWILLAAGL